MRSAFITGIGQGIGLALAVALLADGWYVLGTVRRLPDPDTDPVPLQFRDRLRRIILDMSDLAACAAVAEEQAGPLDVLVCSAASFGNDAFTADNFSTSTFINTLIVNTVAPIVLARTLKPALVAGQSRLIVMMSTGNASVSGNKSGGMLAYRASKSALNQCTRSLAAEWGPQGLTTVALNPGWVRTRMGGELAPLPVGAAAQNILSFIREARPNQNGAFVNTDGSSLPW